MTGKPRTAAATAAVIRRGQNTKAAHLRAAGWLVVPPEQAKLMGAEIADVLRRHQKSGTKTVPGVARLHQVGRDVYHYIGPGGDWLVEKWCYQATAQHGHQVPDWYRDGHDWHLFDPSGTHVASFRQLRQARIFLWQAFEKGNPA